MDGVSRRHKILESLSNASTAITARAFANEMNVSRQVIVGDIALLRAEGHEIIATSKGYQINRHEGNVITIVATHKPEETFQELTILVNNSIEIVDVTIEHPIYGEITGTLGIKSHADIKHFLEQEPELLSSLSGGIHLHRLRYFNELELTNALQELKNHGFIYEN